MIVKNLLQNASNIYEKTRQKLLQNAAAFLLQNTVKFYYKTRQFFITKTRKFYYKMRQVLRKPSILLQNAAGITKCVIYYKTGHSTWCLDNIYTFVSCFDIISFHKNTVNGENGAHFLIQKEERESAKILRFESVIFRHKKKALTDRAVVRSVTI